jgi:DNA-binding FrmR family transcriptional regulator
VISSIPGFDRLCTPTGTGNVARVQIEPNATEDVIKRLRRIEGQVGGIIRMLEEQRDCADVVTQLAATSRALDRAGFKLLSAGMTQCITATANGELEPMSAEQMEKLFLTLA